MFNIRPSFIGVKHTICNLSDISLLDLCWPHVTHYLGSMTRRTLLCEPKDGAKSENYLFNIFLHYFLLLQLLLLSVGSLVCGKKNYQVQFRKLEIVRILTSVFIFLRNWVFFMFIHPTPWGLTQSVRLFEKYHLPPLQHDNGADVFLPTHERADRSHHTMSRQVTSH